MSTTKEVTTFRNSIIVEIQGEKPLLRLAEDTLNAFKHNTDWYRVPCNCDQCKDKPADEKATIDAFFINGGKYTSLPHEPEKINIYAYTPSPYWTRTYPETDEGNRAIIKEIQTA